MSEDIMQQTFDDVADDFDLPNGDYLFEISKYFRGVTKSEEPKEFVEFYMRPVQVLGEDAEVSDDDLVNAYPVKHRLYLSAKAKKISKKFFTETLGFDVTGVPFETLFEMAIGQNVRALTVQETSNNGRVFVTVDRFLRADS